MAENKELVRTNDGRVIPQSKKRDSNLELFRIITMLLIVAHHYVVNSGLTSSDGPIAANPTAGHSIFLLLFGAWGKIGINCFVMITGYFMCKSQITIKKFAKLLGEIMLYKIVIYFIFLITGHEQISAICLVNLILPVTSIQQNFTGCYITFFLFIPFLNILIHHMNERQHIKLLLLLFFTYVLFGTIRGGSFGVTMNYVSWFMALYLIAAYIRLYPKKWFSNNKVCGLLLFISLLLSTASVVCCILLGNRIGKFMPFYFVTDSNAFLAVMTGVLAFLFFKNLKIPYSRLINTIVASTFGVLLIHANSDTMRQRLWKDTLDCVGHYGNQFMPFYAIGSVLGIFVICIIIDIIRIKLLETPFFKWWDKHWDSFSVAYKEKEDKLFKRLNIE